MQFQSFILIAITLVLGVQAQSQGCNLGTWGGKAIYN